MKTSIHIVPTMLLLLCVCISCKKLIEVDPPDDWLESSTIFSNDNQATAAVMGLYSTIMEQTKYFINGGMSLYPSLSADELVRTSNMNNEDQFATNSVSPSNPALHNNIWKPAYAYLYQCNAMIDGLERSNSVSVAIKNRLIGEAKFVRALCYFYLINLFDQVPLVLLTNAEENASMPRTSTDRIYSQIITDLQDASRAVPDIPENTRPNKMACQALLARIFICNKNWISAEMVASEVINSSNYDMVLDLSKVFEFDSRETIFQLAPVLDHYNTAEGYMFIPPSQNLRPAYIVSNNLLAAFDTGDNRATVWLKRVQLNGLPTTFIFPYKYKVYSSDIVSEYNIVLRLAEQYLIRAEARLRKGNVAAAVEDINVIRRRSGLSELLPTINEAECLAALEKERRIELFAEWGHRWIDLKRWGKADAVLSDVKGSNWQSTDKLYPIPASEIERNQELRQNDGY